MSTPPVLTATERVAQLLQDIPWGTLDEGLAGQAAQLIIAAIEDAERAELRANAEAICYYCSAHDEFAPVLWLGTGYLHLYKKEPGVARCRASLIWEDWDRRHREGGETK